VANPWFKETYHCVYNWDCPIYLDTQWGNISYTQLPFLAKLKLFLVINPFNPEQKCKNPPKRQNFMIFV